MNVRMSILKYKLAPSLLSGDFAQLAKECKTMLEYGAEYLHMDIMDGHFVPNITIGAPVIKSLRKHTDAFLDCHLMVSEPEKWIDDFAKAGASLFMFHIEATKNALECIKSIHIKGMKAGLAVKPKTPLSAIEPFLSMIDMVLIMTVEPGFGGQKFMTCCLDKIKKLRDMCPNLDIEVDGGISLETIALAAEAGANVFVAGSAIFQADSPKNIMNEMKNKVKSAINHPVIFDIE